MKADTNVHDIFLKLRVGEKIGFGFGLVGILFLGVIWQYHATLFRSLDDYQKLQDTYVVKKDKVLAIESNLAFARQAEKNFLLERNPIQAQAVVDYIAAAQQDSRLLGNIDGDATALANEFQSFLDKYLQQFKAVEVAWVIKGLDEDLGLQGSFRDAVHNLEASARHLNTDRLYLNLLQIRRAEKDLGLRKDALYQERANSLIEQFRSNVQQSELPVEMQTDLLNELEVYRKEFDIYAATVLAGEDIHGGKGPFRDAAHRLESLINTHYVPDLERDILQLRRREKDYLLRGEEQYVELAVQEIEVIAQQLNRSKISVEKRVDLLSQLNGYRDDFLALVEQNKKIEGLISDMEVVAGNVVGLVRENVHSVNRDMVEKTATIRSASDDRTLWMDWLVVLATVMGIYFAIKITAHIVNPVRKMAGLLEEITYSELVERLPHVENSRDEINAMAGSLNILADHRNRFVNWWRNSMNEAEVCSQLQSIMDNAARKDSHAAEEVDKIKNELKEALAIKKALIASEFEEIRRCNHQIAEGAAVLRHPSVSRGEIDEKGKEIQYASELINKTLDMLSYKN